MSNYNQFRITVNGCQGEILDDFPHDKWTEINEYNNIRGCHAILETRLITDESIFELEKDKRGYIKLNDGTVITPWVILYEI